MKKLLHGKQLGCNDEVIAETNAYFEVLEEWCFLEGIQKKKKNVYWTESGYIEK